MTNATGLWCIRDNELCEHNLSDAPHIGRNVCSGLGGECRRGSAFSGAREIKVSLMRYGGAEHDFMEIEEGRKIDDSILKMLNDHVEREINHLFLTGEKPSTLAIPGALPFGAEGNSAATPMPEPTGEEMMDTLLAELKRLKENPVMMAIWFVDCPERRARFDSIVQNAIGKIFVKTVEQNQPSMWGVPLYDWDMSTSTEDERVDMLKAGRWFCMVPGVWAEMSDLQHRRVEL